MDLTSERDELLQGIDTSAKSHGAVFAQEILRACHEITEWIHFLEKYRLTGAADELLVGARAAILETMACVALGLGRPAILAMRTQIDLVLSHSYFREHPREWKRLGETGDGFMLRSDVMNYHSEMERAFQQRLALIEDASGVSLKGVYQTLSAHVHGQSPYTIPKGSKMVGLVSSEPFLQSIVALQWSTTAAIANFLLAVHADDWTDIPDELLKRADSLLSAKQKAVFF